MSDTVIVRCTRCGVALIPRRAFGSFVIRPDEYAGPCFDPKSGVALPDHPAVTVDATTHGTMPVITVERSFL